MPANHAKPPSSHLQASSLALVPASSKSGACPSFRQIEYAWSALASAIALSQPGSSSFGTASFIMSRMDISLRLAWLPGMLTNASRRAFSVAALSAPESNTALWASVIVWYGARIGTATKIASAAGLPVKPGVTEPSLPT